MFIKKIKDIIDSALVPKSRPHDFSIYDLKYVDNVYAKEKGENIDLINRVLSAHVDYSRADEVHERGMPGDDRYRNGDYYHVMLKRYFFAGAEFCRGKTVLDTCCGYGWGAYILSNYAKSVCAVDSDQRTIDACKMLWNAENIDWHRGDVLDMSSIECLFDVVVGMETIEHFDCDEGIEYLSQISDKLNPNGISIITSAFPYSEEEAEKILSKNPRHKKIYTYDGMNKLAGRFFRECRIVNNWMCLVQK